MQKPEKMTAGWIFKNIASKLSHPGHWSRMYKLSKSEQIQRVAADAQLKLYADLLPSGFIHFGFFEDADIDPETISFRQMEDAQKNHAKLILDWVKAGGEEVLDVGCGTGGLSRLLHERGNQVVALTPDQYQKEFLVSNLPSEIEILHSKFEELDSDAHRGRFTTIICSESLQYLDKKTVLDKVDALLAPGGRWIICDYLRTSPGHAWSFSWGELEEAVQGKFQVLHRRDISANILPTLKYVHMLGARIASPAIGFVVEKVKTKEPAVAYLLGDVLQRAQDVLSYNVHSSDPAKFLKEKSYRLLVLEKPAAGATVPAPLGNA